MGRSRSATLGVILAVAMLSACDMHTSVKGRVRGTEGQPLPGASVELAKIGSDRVHRQRADAEGFFAVGRTHGRRCSGFVVSVSHVGFKPERTKLDCSSTYRCQIELVTASELRPSRIVCTQLERR